MNRLECVITVIVSVVLVGFVVFFAIGQGQSFGVPLSISESDAHGWWKGIPEEQIENLYGSGRIIKPVRMSGGELKTIEGEFKNNPLKSKQFTIEQESIENVVAFHGDWIYYTVEDEDSCALYAYDVNTAKDIEKLTGIISLDVSSDGEMIYGIKQSEEGQEMTFVYHIPTDCHTYMYNGERHVHPIGCEDGRLLFCVVEDDNWEMVDDFYIVQTPFDHSYDSRQSQQAKNGSMIVKKWAKVGYDYEGNKVGETWWGRTDCPMPRVTDDSPNSIMIQPVTPIFTKEGDTEFISQKLPMKLSDRQIETIQFNGMYILYDFNQEDHGMIMVVDENSSLIPIGITYSEDSLPEHATLVGEHLVWLDMSGVEKDEINSIDDYMRPQFDLMAYHIPSEHTFKINHVGYGVSVNANLTVSAVGNCIYYNTDRLDDDTVNPMIIKTRLEGVDSMLDEYVIFPEEIHMFTVGEEDWLIRMDIVASPPEQDGFISLNKNIVNTDDLVRVEGYKNMEDKTMSYPMIVAEDSGDLLVVESIKEGESITGAIYTR